MVYFSSHWLIIGLYVCPSLIGLSLPILIYLQCQQQVRYSIANKLFLLLNPFLQSKLPFIYHIQLGLHSWAIVLTVLVFGLSSLGVRSVYIFVFPLTFYTFALMFNLLTTHHDRGFRWAGTVTTFQLMPYLYSCYIIYTFVVVMTPMTGRSGSDTNPDNLIAFMAALGTLLAFGFLVSKASKSFKFILNFLYTKVPLIHLFRRPSVLLFTLALATGLSIYLATSTQIGFPYRTKTNTGRVYYQVRYDTTKTNWFLSIHTFFSTYAKPFMSTTALC